jgi:hypothetical protein
MTHDLETTLNASVSSSPGNKKIWTPPVVQPLWGAEAAGERVEHAFAAPLEPARRRVGPS